MKLSDQPKTPTAAARRHGKLRRWRHLQALGGLMLASAFFMPAVKGCNAPIVPAEEVFSGLSDGLGGIDDWLWSFLVYVAAYLFGLLSCLAVLRHRHQPATRKKKPGISIAVLFGAVVGLLVVALIAELRSASVFSLGGTLFAILILVSCAFWLRSVHMGPGGLLSLRWYAAVCCIIWFGWWWVHLFTGETIYYGMWVSLAGSVLLAISCVAEASIRCRSSTWATLRKLLTCRLRLFDLDAPHCLNCGYLLIGLTSPRCPECGQPFEWEEYDLPRPDFHATKIVEARTNPSSQVTDDL